MSITLWVCWAAAGVAMTAAWARSVQAQALLRLYVGGYSRRPYGWWLGVLPGVAAAGLSSSPIVHLWKEGTPAALALAVAAIAATTFPTYRFLTVRKRYTDVELIELGVMLNLVPFSAVETPPEVRLAAWESLRGTGMRVPAKGLRVLRRKAEEARLERLVRESALAALDQLPEE